MNTLSSRRRRAAGLMLGTWLFALFVSFAQACDWHAALDGNGAACASSASATSSHESCLADCDEFCANDIPVVTRLPVIGGPSDSSPLVPRIARADFVREFAPTILPPGDVRPVSGLPPFLRINRLRL